MQIDVNYIDYIDQASYPTNIVYRSEFNGEQYEQPFSFINDHNVLISSNSVISSSEGVYTLRANVSDDRVKTVNTINEMVKKIRSVFGLNASQAANLIGVSRPSLYNHISKKEAPKDMDAYNRIYDLALQVEAEVGRDLKRGLKSIIVEGKTLLQHLKQRPLDAQQVMTIAKQVQEKLNSMENDPEELSLTKQRIISRSVTRAG